MFISGFEPFVQIPQGYSKSTLSEWLSEWQGNLMSWSGQLKIQCMYDFTIWIAKSKIYAKKTIKSLHWSFWYKLGICRPILNNIRSILLLFCIRSSERPQEQTQRDSLLDPVMLWSYIVSKISKELLRGAGLNWKFFPRLKLFIGNLKSFDLG